MGFEERIERMEAAGTLTLQQATEMRASLDDTRSLSMETPHKKLPLGKLVMALIAFFIVILMLADGGGVESGTIQNVSETMNEIGKVGAMNKGMTTSMSLIVILLPLIASIIYFVTIYNDIVIKEEEVIASWSQVESNYQRRADLIPNLVETVKGFVEHEEEILIAVTKARQVAMSSLQDMDKNLENQEALAALSEAQSSLGSHITRLFGLVENYPQLRSADNFLALQDQLEGTENRINIARMVFNESVRDYNSSIRKMPGTLVAGMGSFNRKAYFEVDDGEATVRKIDF